MLKRSFGLAGLLILAATVGAGAAPFFKKASIPPSFPIPLEELALRQDEVRQVLMNPTLVARGPSETFECKPEQYYFFLEHPDLAVTTWRRMGAKCVSIMNRSAGQFGWTDEYGSEVSWETVHHDRNMRIWYAHGKVRAAAMLPMVPVELILVLHHTEKRSPDGATAKMEHHSDLYLHTDSKTAVLFARLMGTSTNRLAEQGLGQLQLFFSALSWYLEQHPERAKLLMREFE